MHGVTIQFTLKEVLRVTKSEFFEGCDRQHHKEKTSSNKKHHVYIKP